MTERFTVRLEAKIEKEWHVISELENSGSQNTGRLRRVAENSVVPMRVVECHD